jgi:hypothetical protein
MASDDVLKLLLDLVDKLSVSVRMPRFRYWRVRGNHYAFAYTTERTSDGKFWALKYRITRKAWKLVRKAAFGRRKMAKARAYKWYQQRKAKLEAKA